LRETLILPTGEGPHPALAFTHGAEPANRKREGYQRFVRQFAEQGVAVLIYDTRGVGESEGTYIEAPDLRQPCADLLGAVAFLREHSSIDRESIGVWGASQGGWVAPMAASMCDDIRYVCIVSGPGVSPLEQNLYDKGLQLQVNGLSVTEAKRATAFRRAFWGYLITGEGFAEARRLQGEIAEESWFTPGNFPIPFGSRENLMRGDGMRHFAIHNGYEPRLTLERVRVPLLAIFGAADRVVPVDSSIEAFRSAFAASGNEGKLTVKVFPGAGHGIQVVGEDDRVLPAPGYEEFMTDWVARKAFRFD
jgi:dipeptidyl aminopeptidase/acylaminoacyl peptidase